MEETLLLLPLPRRQAKLTLAREARRPATGCWWRRHGVEEAPSSLLPLLWASDSERTSPANCVRPPANQQQQQRRWRRVM
jgi:hypothetical protein